MVQDYAFRKFPENLTKRKLVRKQIMVHLQKPYCVRYPNRKKALSVLSFYFPTVFFFFFFLYLGIGLEEK